MMLFGRLLDKQHPLGPPEDDTHGGHHEPSPGAQADRRPLPGDGAGLVPAVAGSHLPAAGRGRPQLRSRQVDLAGRARLGHKRRRQGVHGRMGLPAGLAQLRDGFGSHWNRLPDPCLLDGIHGARRWLLPLFRIPQPLPVLHAGPGLGEQLRVSVRRLGRCRLLQLRADRVLLPQEVGFERRQQGIHRQPRRRRRVRAGHAADIQHARHAEVHRDRTGSRGWRLPRGGFLGAAEPHRPAVLHRCHGQVGAAPAACLAAGRDGGPDTGLGADPRRHHGDSRRLPGGSIE